MIQTNWSSEFERVWRSSHILTLTLTRFSLEKKKKKFWISKPKSPSNYSNDTDELVLGVWARLKKFPYFNPNPNSFFPRKKKNFFFGFQSQKALQTIAMIQTNWSSEFERVWRSSHILTLTLTRFSLEKKKKKFWISKPKSPSNYSNDTDELVLGVWARLKKFPYFNPNPNSFFPRKKKKKILDFKAKKPFKL